jgi:signal transduction histidine kinase
VSQTNPEHVLVHAPFGRDAAMICQFLAQAGVSTKSCSTVEDVCAQIEEDTGAVFISDESLTAGNISALVAVLNAQPPWSDLPVIVTTSGGEATLASRRRLDILGPLGNFSLLERPLRTVTLVSAVKTALRARRRQYQLREHVAERERLVQELKRSNEELTQFAHVVSHDLQAPVRMVKTFSELLARRYRGQIDETANEFIGTIQDGASTMETLIRTLLAYATVGQGPLSRKRVGLGSVVDAVITMLQPSIDELHAAVSYGDLPTVHGDRVLLQQLVQNLVGNALKYVGDAAPRVNIAAHPAGGEWVVSVKDNGPGIAAEHQESVFQPLKRLHGSEISGTGMGLAVCRKIAERHGGRIWVESRPGNGCTFFFTLPKLERAKKSEGAASGSSKEQISH